MVVIDTSIIIDYLRQTDKKETVFEKFIASGKDLNLSISLVTVQELFEGKSAADPTQQDIIIAIVTPLNILPYTYDVAKKAGEINRNRPPGTKISFADAAIAATSILNNAQLLTLNKKDFKDIEGISIL